MFQFNFFLSVSVTIKIIHRCRNQETDPEASNTPPPTETLLLFALTGLPQCLYNTEQFGALFKNNMPQTHQLFLSVCSAFFSSSLERQTKDCDASKVRLRDIRDKVRFTWVAPSSTVFFNLWTSSIKGISVSIATGLLRSEESTYTENYVENKGKNKHKRMEKRLSVACKGDLSPDDKTPTHYQKLRVCVSFSKAMFHAVVPSKKNLSFDIMLPTALLIIIIYHN